jgi:hypothetical protein
MAIAPLAVIALARGEGERARRLVDEHDRRCGVEVSVFESDFRCLRGAILAAEGDDANAVAEIISGAEVADFAEWAGWLAPVVDLLVLQRSLEPLVEAQAALSPEAKMRHTPPVQTQAERLAAHIAWRRGDLPAAIEHWAEAERLAKECSLEFERAVIVLERAEARGDGRASGIGLAGAQAVFERLGAAPWSRRAR